MTDTPLFELIGKHPTKSIPPVTHRFVSDINPSLMQNVFYLPQTQRKTDVIHHRQPDDFG
jgi:hypothetical protein